METPTVLYQYMTEAGVDLVRSLRIKTSCPHEMNDPFEWTPAVEELSIQEIRAGTLERYKNGKLVKKPSAPDFARLKRDQAIVNASFQRDIAKHLSQEQRLICLSNCNNGILLWAHYTDKHKGFVVGLKTSEILKQCPGSGPHEVKYEQPRALAKGPFAPSSATTQKEVINIFTTKSMDWTAEKEWRFLAGVRQLRAIDESKTHSLYLHIPPTAIDSVIFGSRCSDKLKRDIDDAFTE